MFGYRSNVPKVRLTTDRLVVRLVHERDTGVWQIITQKIVILKTLGTYSR
jgi:hypothetical protein